MSVSNQKKDNVNQCSQLVATRYSFSSCHDISFDVSKREISCDDVVNLVDVEVVTIFVTLSKRRRVVIIR